MELASCFPVWDKLTPAQQQKITGAAERRAAGRGTVLHNGSEDCMGLLAVRSGQLRAYMLSEEGREITLYRLFERDICLFSASCMMSNIQFDVTIEAERDAEVWVIPPGVYKELTEQSAPLANYTNQVMASRFSEVMWLMEQVLWKSMDKRLAAFLLEEAALEGGNLLDTTHEKIANHLGTAREVVTRMLRYFQGEGMVRLARGAVEITDPARLEGLRDA